MKRLLFPLLAALALPTAVNAKPIYLSCEFNETRSFIGTQINELLNTWRESESNPVEFTLNENDQSGSIFYRDQNFMNAKLNNITAKIDFITFQPESIVISVVPIRGNSAERYEEKYTISRVDGSIFRKLSKVDGMMRYEYKGICTKSESKKNLF